MLCSGSTPSVALFNSCSFRVSIGSVYRYFLLQVFLIYFNVNTKTLTVSSDQVKAVSTSSGEIRVRVRRLSERRRSICGRSGGRARARRPFCDGSARAHSHAHTRRAARPPASLCSPLSPSVSVFPVKLSVLSGPVPADRPPSLPPAGPSGLSTGSPSSSVPP